MANATALTYAALASNHMAKFTVIGQGARRSHFEKK